MNKHPVVFDIKPVHAPADIDLPTLVALKAFAAGEANGDQQKRVYKWLVEEVGMYGASEFDPDSERNSSFAGGRRYTARQIAGYVALPLDKFKQADAKVKNVRRQPEPRRKS